MEAITVEFTYTVDTDGKVDPDSIVVPMENAILDDVAEYIESHEDYGGFTGRIHAAPEDHIASKCVQNLPTCCQSCECTGEMSILCAFGAHNLILISFLLFSCHPGQSSQLTIGVAMDML